MDEIVKQGYEIGKEYINTRQNVENLIYKITTNPNKNFEKIKLDIVEICTKVSKPIPEFLNTLNDTEYPKILSFLLGLNNGSLGSMYEKEFLSM